MLNDPNFFGGSVKIIRNGGDPMDPCTNDHPPQAWFTNPNAYTLPITHPFRESSRGLGVADMAYAIRNNRRPRADCDLGYHAFEVIHGIRMSGESGQLYEMTSRCERPEPIPCLGLTGTAEEFCLDN